MTDREALALHNAIVILNGIAWLVRLLWRWASP